MQNGLLLRPDIPKAWPGSTRSRIDTRRSSEIESRIIEKAPAAKALLKSTAAAQSVDRAARDGTRSAPLLGIRGARLGPQVGGAAPVRGGQNLAMSDEFCAVDVETTGLFPGRSGTIYLSRIMYLMLNRP